MPLYLLACPECGAAGEEFCHVPEDRGTRTHLCGTCHASMAHLLSVGTGLTWFEEGRARTLWNLGHEPVTVRSHEEHRRLMKERGVEWVTKGQGEKGCWV